MMIINRTSPRRHNNNQQNTNFHFFHNIIDVIIVIIITTDLLLLLRIRLCIMVTKNRMMNERNKKNCGKYEKSFQMCVRRGNAL